MTKYYHLIGIGGIGVGTLALLFLDNGISISGSDLADNDMTRLLRDRGAKIFIGHLAENISNPDCVICSSAISQDNPEIIEAKKKKILIKKRGQALAELVEEKETIIIAGAHGKTTTSALVAHILSIAGLDPAAAIGGVVKTGQYSSLCGKGKHFVAEADESDGSFLYFHPKQAIITNADFEHVDFYKNLENLIDAYKKFISQIHENGSLFYCGDDKTLNQLAQEFKGSKTSYGLDSSNDIFADEIISNGFKTKFCYHGKEQDSFEFELNIPGYHNILNALGAIGMSLSLGVSVENIKKSLETFQGVERRFSWHGDFKGVCVVDDYAHHPKEIAVTLKAAKNFKKKRVVVVFQPHRFSRTSHFKDEFVDVLQNCDQLIITDIYSASEKPQGQISASMICDEISQKRENFAVYQEYDCIVDYLLENSVEGDFVLFLGAGNINRLAKKLSEQLAG